MTIIGFSHIVYETKNLTQSINFYEKHGFNIVKEFKEKIRKDKLKILNGNPSKVKLFYLKKNNSNSIGIEVICHNNINKKKSKKQIIYGVSSHSNNNKEHKGPGGEILYNLSKNISGQHLFIPSNDLNKTINFYIKNFNFIKKKTSNSLKKLINSKFKSVKNIVTLNLKNVLIEAWDVNLHFFNTNSINCKINLNNIGINCMCFLIKDKKNYFFKDKKKLIGPFKHKIDNEIFETGFIRDPNNFLIEYFLKK